MKMISSVLGSLFVSLCFTIPAFAGGGPAPSYGGASNGAGGYGQFQGESYYNPSHPSRTSDSGFSNSPYYQQIAYPPVSGLNREDRRSTSGWDSSIQVATPVSQVPVSRQTYLTAQSPVNYLMLDYGDVCPSTPGANHSNPTSYPKEGLSPGELDETLAPLKQAKESGNLFALSEKLSELQLEMDGMRASFDRRMGASAQYLESEAKRLFVDSRGLLKDLPHVALPPICLLTRPDSEEGAKLRKSLNDFLVSESIVGGGCQGAQGEFQESCGEALVWLEEMKLAHFMVDRLAAQHSPEAPEILSNLERASEFAKGFASGIAEEALALARGVIPLLGRHAAMRHMIRNAPEIVGGIYIALSTLPRTYSLIQEFARREYNHILHADDRELGRIAGGATLEVGGVCFGGMAAARIARVGGQFTRALSAAFVRASVETFAEVATVDGRLTLELAADLRGLNREVPFLAREAVNDAASNGFSEVAVSELRTTLERGGIPSRVMDSAGAGANVWNRISHASESWPRTQIPRHFQVEAGTERFWVNPNATEHMAEYLARSHTHTTPMNHQGLLNSFHQAVEEAVRTGAWRESVQTGRAINVGDWEIAFRAPRSEGLLPAIVHALRR